MSNQVIERKPNGQFAKGVSGNLNGNAHRSRHELNADTIREMHRAFREGGRKAIDEVMKTQPAVFLKLLVLLVPREMRVEHSGGVKALTDGELERGIEMLTAILAARDAGEQAKVIEVVPEPAALPAPRKPRRKAKRIADPEPSTHKDTPQDHVETAGGPAASEQVRFPRREPRNEPLVKEAIAPTAKGETHEWQLPIRS
jgi:hypothetical protein